MHQDERNYLVKKLLYKSSHRGCKETDFILGKFADNFLDRLSNDELLDFEMILNQMDQDILDWVHKKMPIPSNISQNLFRKIILSFQSN